MILCISYCTINCTYVNFFFNLPPVYFLFFLFPYTKVEINTKTKKSAKFKMVNLYLLMIHFFNFLRVEFANVTHIYECYCMDAHE